MSNNERSGWHLPDRLRPIRVDFNKSFSKDTVALTTVGTRRDLEKYGAELTEGLVLYLYDADENEEGEPDDVWTTGVVRWNEERGHWEEAIGPGELRHVSRSEIEWGA